MHVINRKRKYGLLPASGALCLSVASAAWGYSTYLSPHGSCVGQLEQVLKAEEFALVPDRAGQTADWLCDRANDRFYDAWHLFAGVRK